jgi:DNA-binding CsgD family transcriptional regulator/pimeloyl-ACP methyl ester carboxylesterase
MAIRPVMQRALTTDGQSIAYSTLGTGPALVMVFPYHVNHLTLNWQVPLHREAFEYFANEFTVINLDFRGAGESAQPGSRVSLDAFGRDLEAVLRAVGVEKACFCAMGPAALVACHYAAGAPERVSAIAFIQGGESRANAEMLKLRSFDAGIEARLRGVLLGGTADPMNANALAAVAKHALGSEPLMRWGQVLAETRLEDLAQNVRAPCLCLHAAGDDLIPLTACQALVARLPNATLRLVAAPTGMQMWRETEALEALMTFFASHCGERVRPLRRHRRSHRRYPAALTRREAEVLKLIAAGKTNRQVAAELDITANTVSHHLRSIFAKTSSANRTEAAAFAHSHGLG